VLSTHYGHSLLVHADGTVWAWGWNDLGQLGTGTVSAPQATPGQVVELTDVVSVSAQDGYSLGVRRDGSVWSWGMSAPGGPHGGTPMQVAGLSQVVRAEAGRWHAVALRADGTVWTWGANFLGQLGRGWDWDVGHQPAPAPVPGLSDVVDIAAGESHALALRRDGTVWAWGSNQAGELGNLSTWASAEPLPVEGLSDVVALEATASGSLALRADGTVWVWGLTNSGPPSIVLRRLEGLSDIVALTSSTVHNLALRADGTVWAWGWNFFGQLGDGTQQEGRRAPAPVVGLDGVVAIAASQDHSLALRRDGSLWAWGSNHAGLLGQSGGPQNVLAPARTPLPCRFTALPSLEHRASPTQQCHEAR
jgi:alpha-tubulin suppressor-like RCC1 family protein